MSEDSSATVISSGVIFAVPSNDTPPIFLAVARAVAVSAFPVTSPVTLPVTAPSRLATSVATAYPVPLVFTVVSGSASLSLNNLN